MQGVWNSDLSHYARLYYLYLSKSTFKPKNTIQNFAQPNFLPKLSTVNKVLLL